MYRAMRGLVVPILATCSFVAECGAVEDPQWFMTMGGVSKHARETQVQGRNWNQTHSGMGLEHRSSGLPWARGAGPDWQVRWTAGTLEDSREIWGSYAGMGLLREVAHYGTMRLHMGTYTSLYYKSTSWRGTMKLMPAVLPTLSLTDRHSGLAANLTWVPPVRALGRDTIATVLLQVQYRVEH